MKTKLCVISFLAICIFNSQASESEANKDTKENTKNESSNADPYYAKKNIEDAKNSYLSMLKSNLTLEAEIRKLKGESLKPKKTQKKYTPIKRIGPKKPKMKILGIWERTALVSFNGFERTVSVGDKFGNWVVQGLTPLSLTIEHSDTRTREKYNIK